MTPRACRPLPHQIVRPGLVPGRGHQITRPQQQHQQQQHQQHHQQQQRQQQQQHRQQQQSVAIWAQAILAAQGIMA